MYARKKRDADDSHRSATPMPRSDRVDPRASDLQRIGSWDGEGSEAGRVRCDAFPGSGLPIEPGKRKIQRQGKPSGGYANLIFPL